MLIRHRLRLQNAQNGDWFRPGGKIISLRWRVSSSHVKGLSEESFMSLAREIAPQLPYLRRFSRALNGTQASGDAFVAATLEALIADPAAFPRDLPVRQALYRVFLKLWSSTAQTDHSGRGGDAIERNLEALHRCRARRSCCVRSKDSASRRWPQSSR